MAKEFKKVELVEEEAAAPKTDFVQLVKDAVHEHGSTRFLRISLDKHVTDDGLEALNKEFTKEGYEVFSSKKAVLLLKQ